MRFFLLLFTSTLWQRRSNKAGLKCPYVYVRSFVHKMFFDFIDILLVGRGRWVVHDSMQYDLIQGQRQGHELFKVGNPVILKSYLLCHLQWELATDHGFLN